MDSEQSFPPNERKSIFTEELDYSQTGEDSIWGKGYDITLKKIKEGLINGGNWINVAGGDGRYCPELLENADFVTATDIDSGALKKLKRVTPEKDRSRLDIVAFNMAKKFPFADGEFNGAFCAGILHLFPKKMLPEILKEFKRIVKPGGRIVIELPTNIKRVAPDGKTITFPSQDSEPLYSFEEGKKLLEKHFADYEIEISQEDIQEDCLEANPPFEFNSTLLLLIAEKNELLRQEM